MKFCRLALGVLFASAAWSQSTDTPASPDQAGPTILSRADMQVPDSTAENHGGNYANFFVFVRGFYNTSAGNYTDNGALQNYEATGGVDAGGGLNLVHNFEHGEMALAYSGGYREYSNGEGGSSFYQNLALSLNYKLNRRWLLALREYIQVLPEGQVAVPLSLGTVSPVAFNSVANQQQYYLSSASLVYQASRRWSYEFGGDFFYLAYHPDSFFNSKGFSGSGSTNYRKSSRTTVGMGYNFNYFVFSGGVGNSNTNTVYASLSHLFSPTLQFGLSAGASRTDFSQEVAAADGAGAYDFHRASYSPFINARLSKASKRYTETLVFVEGVNAGNGVYATSKSLNASAGIGYSVSRRFGFNAAAGYSHFSSIAGPTLNVSGSYAYFYATGGVSRKVAKHFGTNFSATYYGAQNLGGVASHDYVALYGGIVFTSEDRPVLTF